MIRARSRDGLPEPSLDARTHFDLFQGRFGARGGVRRYQQYGARRT